MKSQLPIGAGLGSSAAFSVALAGALLACAGRVSAGPKQNDGANSEEGAEDGIVYAWTDEVRVCVCVSVQVRLGRREEFQTPKGAISGWYAVRISKHRIADFRSPSSYKQLGGENVPKSRVNIPTRAYAMWFWSTCS